MMQGDLETKLNELLEMEKQGMEAEGFILENLTVYQECFGQNEFYNNFIDDYTEYLLSLEKHYF